MTLCHPPQVNHGPDAPKARTFFAVSTLALAVASVGIFAIPALMEQAMNREVRASKLYDLQLSMSPVKLSRADVRAIGTLPNVRAVVARPWFMTRAYAGTQRVRALVIGAPELNQQRVDRVTVTSGGLPAGKTVLTDNQNARQGVWSGEGRRHASDHFEQRRYPKCARDR